MLVARGVAINPGRPPRCEFPRPAISLATAFMPSILPTVRKNCHARGQAVNSYLSFIDYLIAFLLMIPAPRNRRFRYTFVP